MRSNPANTSDTLMRLADVIETRKPANGGDPDKSYVARLLHKGPDAFLKKIGEEATETVMAASMIALAYYGLTTTDVVDELARREGLSGLEEKALRKVQQRENSGE
jgi:phosphoribosyl-ATP pyrophosphohydrolase